VQKALDLNLTPSKNTLKIRTVVPFVKQREWYYLSGPQVEFKVLEIFYFLSDILSSIHILMVLYVYDLLHNKNFIFDKWGNFIFIFYNQGYQIFGWLIWFSVRTTLSSI
jgi:hypothetical protein